MNRYTAVGALLCVVGSTPVFAECTAADRAALEAFDVAWTKASDAGDRAALTRMLSDDFRNSNVLGGGSKAANIENTVRLAGLNAANPQPQGTQDHYVFICTPALATITHRNISAVTAPATGPTYSRTTHVLEKKGNSWQVVTTTGNALTDQQALTYMEQDWNDAWKNGNVAWFEKNYAPFAHEIDSRTGSLKRKDAVITDVKNNKETYDTLELSGLSIRVEGDVGMVTGVNTIKGKDAQGKPMDLKIRFTDTFIRRDGQWQVWASQSTPTK